MLKIKETYSKTRFKGFLPALVSVYLHNSMKVPLYPLSLLYDGITRGRNRLYDRGWFHSFAFDPMLISVGNLSVGGTGKTPMVEYLLRLLQPQYALATLSRGYGRKTKGFRLAGPEDSALSLGDEPFQYYRKWKSLVPVAVGEDRAMAITQLLEAHPELNLILLDDAYQHRRVRPDLNILLTTYDRPFWTDKLLPLGRLRENRKGARRAHALVVTKCPESIAEKEKAALMQKAAKYLSPGVPVFFSSIVYEDPKPLFKRANSEKHPVTTPAVLLSGLARPKPLEDWVRQRYRLQDHLQFGDHHNFTPANIDRLQKAHAQHARSGAVILTSEKDAVRLLQPEVAKRLHDLPVYYIPIRQRFLDSTAGNFDALILKSAAEKLRDRH